jgi:hypothetical protein
MATGQAKNRGMIFHLAHLPAKGSACGQLNDPETDDFIDFLAKSKQTHWIINPLTPIGDDLSPYNTSSRFDRNKYFINLNQLTSKQYGKLLEEFDLPDDLPLGGYSLNILKAQKDSRFKKAYLNFKKLKSNSKIVQEYEKYCLEEGEKWLDNNSIHEGIVENWGYDWKFWPNELKFLPEETHEKPFERKIKYLKKYDIPEYCIDIIEQFRFEQFIFNKQFREFKEKLDQNGIKLFVDLAYAVSQNGKDVWSQKDIVELDENYNPKRVTGCPPEVVYPMTQRWGQAVWNYNSKNFWKYQEDSIRHLLKEGCIRLDHFGGLINRGAIPTKWERDGKTLYGSAIFKPKEEGGFGPELWEDEWLEDVFDLTNNRNENLIDMYIRVAIEEGLDPKSTFIVEDLGSVCVTKACQNFIIKYQDTLAGLRLPVTYGIDLAINSPKLIDDPHNDSNPYNIKGGVENVALLSGSHDPPALMEVIDTLLDSTPLTFDGGYVNSPHHFRAFCQAELGITPDKLWDHYYVSREVLKWLYSKPARHVQTTISDALGIYFRPNIPGGWNGSENKWNMKNTIDGLFNYWGKQFPKGFLTRDDKGGIFPGYKERADLYIAMMNDLFPDE